MTGAGQGRRRLGAGLRAIGVATVVATAATAGPVAAQDGAAAPAESGQSWYDFLSGYAGAAVEAVTGTTTTTGGAPADTGSADTGSAGATAAAGEAEGEAEAGGAAAGSAASGDAAGGLTVDQMKAYAGSAWQMIGGVEGLRSAAAGLGIALPGGGEGAADPAAAEAAAAGAGGGPSLEMLTGMFGGGEAGRYLSDIFVSLGSLTAAQRTAFLDGVTQQLPGLMAEAQAWWNSLDAATRQGYLEQLKATAAYLFSLATGMMSQMAPSGQ